MWLAYVDESGDCGDRGSAAYAIAAVMVRSEQWPDQFDALLSFRRFLNHRFGLQVHAEVKASTLLRGSGVFRSLRLAERARRDMYRMHMQFADKRGLRVFAVVIDKELVHHREVDLRQIAWRYAVQRLERLSTKTNTGLMVIHDDGEALQVRKLIRWARRANVAGSAFDDGHLERPARLLIEDPVPRASEQSFFIQLADLCAYAAYRRVRPPPPNRTAVCPPQMWDWLGNARHGQASGLKGDPDKPGIVIWPRAEKTPETKSRG